MTEFAESKRSPLRSLLKWLGILLLVLLLLLVLVLGIVWVLAGTDKGFAFVTDQVSERVEGLEIGEVQGNLTKGIRTDALSFKNDTLDIQASGVETAWRLGCLTQREFCLDKAIIDELYVATTPAEDAEPPPEPREGDIVLPEIALPIDFTAREVLVRKLRFQPPGDAPEQVLENIALSARTAGKKVFLDNASLTYQTYDAALSGNILLEGDYPLEMALGADLREVLPGTLFEAGVVPADPMDSADPTDPTDPTDSTDPADPTESAEPADPAPPVEDPAARDLRIDIQLGNSVSELDISGDVTGAVELHLEGRVEPLRETLPLTLALTAATLGFPLDSHAQVKATDLNAAIDGTLDDYAFGVTTALGGEQVPDTSIDIAGLANTERVKVSDIGVDTLGGTIEGDAAVSWVEGLTWLTNIDMSNIDPSIQVETLAGSLDGIVRARGGVDENGDWTLDLDQARIEGTLQDYPFTLDTRIQRGTDGVFRIETLTLDNGDNRVDAAGTVGAAWDIEATARLPQLENFVPGLAGGFAADIGLSGPLEEPSIALDASSSSLALNDLAITGLSLKADVARAALEPSTLDFAVGEIRIGESSILNTRLGVDGSRADHRLNFFADGPEATAIELALSGSLSETFDWLGSLDAVTLDVPAHVIKLREPTALAWNNAEQQFAVDAHCWTTEGTNLCLENEVLAAADGTAVISLDRYLLERLDPFLPAETMLSGALSADATINWGGELEGGYAANVALLVEDGGATVIDANDDPVSFLYDALSLQADVDPTAVEATLGVRSPTMGEAMVAVQLDPSDEARNIDGNLSLDGFKIDFLKAFLPDFEEITGVINASGDLSGKLTDPRFDGQVVLDDLAVSAETLPLPITAGRIATNVRGKRAFIEGGIESGAEGRIAINGNVSWNDLPAWRADVTLKGKDLPIRSVPLTDSLVNHDISINARPDLIAVSGSVDIPYATINVKDLPKGASTLSDDIVIIEDIEEDAEEAAANPPSDLNLRVGLDVSLGDKVSVDAYGLIAKLTGDMNVVVRSPNPVQLGGEIRVVDGVYKQYGQNLEASGEVTFVGPVNQSALAIEAIRRIDSEEPERIAGLKIVGTIAKPEIELFTEPGDKAEESILSYIVLGRDLGEANDQEANLLATAALALGAKGGRTLGQNVADTLGIEDFALETRGSGDDTELLVSGRLSDRLLLRYGQSVFNAGANTLYLRYDLGRQLYLEAASGVLNDAVDLIYQFSF